MQSQNSAFSEIEDTPMKGEHEVSNNRASSEDSLSSSHSSSDVEEKPISESRRNHDKDSDISLASPGQDSPSPEKPVESVTSAESSATRQSLKDSNSAEAPDSSANTNGSPTDPSVSKEVQPPSQPPKDGIDSNKAFAQNTSANESRYGSTEPAKGLEALKQFPTDDINLVFLRLSNATVNTKRVDDLLLEHQISILLKSSPMDTEEYANHLNRIATILFEAKFDPKYTTALHEKYTALLDIVQDFVSLANPLKSQLYLVIERNFEVMMKISTSYKSLDISAATIRFLTTVFMNLNYWELYNLLTWKPVIYHFLNLIGLDIHECYQKFLNDYEYYSYENIKQPLALPRSRVRSRKRKIRKLNDDQEMTAEEKERTERFFSLNPDTADHDKYVADIVSGANKQKRTFRPDVKLEHHKIIKKPVNPTTYDRVVNKSSNYDPDVVHECQLPSAEIPHRLCLRRFSRKYELIRHQETVHSKKKKLFKCYVCVKQNPGVGPRIFTRHDTLAKHIRVNHEIFGKEAKAEVAYSKKHAEVVEEGDITVHVGRRKTKVDFELRANMGQKGAGGAGGANESFGGYLETSDLESGDEEVVFNNQAPIPQQTQAQ